MFHERNFTSNFAGTHLGLEELRTVQTLLARKEFEPDLLAHDAEHYAALKLTKEWKRKGLVTSRMQKTYIGNDNEAFLLSEQGRE